jgi:hypothetical protein
MAATRCGESIIRTTTGVIAITWVTPSTPALAVSAGTTCPLLAIGLGKGIRTMSALKEKLYRVEIFTITVLSALIGRKVSKHAVKICWEAQT